MNILLRGMHGLGDCVHQRAVVRALQKAGNRVTIETPWPQLYTDLPDLGILLPQSTLRTQNKNVQKLLGIYKPLDENHLSQYDSVIKNWYTGAEVREFGFVGTMLRRLGLPEDIDFSLPTISKNEVWRSFVPRDRKIMIYRPLVDRKEWDGCENRNPDAKAYKALVDSIRENYFVISIADLIPEVEWITSEPVDAQLELHQGNLGIEGLMWLFNAADLVFCSPGFALPLAQAFGTKVVCVFGGRENSKFYTQNENTLGVDTVQPCSCFDHRHNCVKTIDLDSQIPRVKAFAGVA